jgi:hypothetical protein
MYRTDFAQICFVWLQTIERTNPEKNVKKSDFLPSNG